MTAQKVQSNGYIRYSREVYKSTLRYEKLNAENAKSNTITRQVTPEEKSLWEQNIHKQNENYLLTQLLKGGKING